MAQTESTTVRVDPIDLRDRYYQPALRALATETERVLARRVCLKPPALPYELRSQGQSGTCTGQALANLIDMDRIRAADGAAVRPDRVSARMLYQMGLLQERRPGGAQPDGVTSLRSVIKGFYHNGVCTDALWPDRDDETTLLPDRAKSARATTLGAYYRVQSYLNDYHAALSEADCILVSAATHSGWKAVKDGVIPLQPEPGENHAFVVVGYNDRGFLVLNSWGGDWGGYCADGRVLPGVALWTYEDWSANVLDAWVLRLGVSSPGAFSHSYSRRGIFFDDGPIEAASAPCHQLLGHFAHLDDGVHVKGGSYASSRESVALTAERIAARPERPVHISLPGSLLGIDTAFYAEVERRAGLEDGLGMYPYTLFWCNDIVESTTNVLNHLFASAVTRVGALSPNLNAQIESETAGIGRAFWRDLKRAARRAGKHGTPGDKSDGAAADLFDRFAATGARLHLTADGAGVLLLEQYLRSLQGSPKADTFLDAVSSLTLITPTIRPRSFAAAFEPLVARLKQRGPDRATLWVPSYGFERKLAVGHYSRSILDLVLYAFEGADTTRDSFVGMSAKRSGIRRLTAPGCPLEGLSVKKIKTPDHAVQPREMRRRRYTQHHVIAHRDARAEMLAQLEKIKGEDATREELPHGQDNA